MYSFIPRLRYNLSIKRLQLIHHGPEGEETHAAVPPPRRGFVIRTALPAARVEKPEPFRSRACAHGERDERPDPHRLPAPAAWTVEIQVDRFQGQHRNENR